MGHRIDRCRSCGAEIRFVRMAKTGKFNPLDPAPDPARGNVLELDDENEAFRHGYPGKEGCGIALGPDDAAALRSSGRDLYVSHFVTCPNRGQHRKR